MSTTSLSATTPTWTAPTWDPYQVAARPAAFTGTITSTSGQYLLPQPMPRVPYYTQQPVAATGAAQPYVVIPDPGCAAPVVSSAPLATSAPLSTTAPIFAPPPVSGTVIAPGPTVPAYTPPPAVPILANPICAPPIYTSTCYANFDAIFFTRDARIGNTPLVLLDMNGATQSNVLLSTSDLNFNYEVGPRLLLGHSFDPYNAFEASYFGIYNWQDKATINGNNNLNLPGDLGADNPLDFTDADQVRVTYDSVIHNAELNYVRTFGNLSWLAGFRYFNLQERFSLAFFDNQNDTGTYHISTYNNLFGGQIGGRVLENCCGNFSYDLTGKAGVYGNVIRESQNVTDFANFGTVRNTKADGGQVAFIGDVEFNASYQFSQCLSLRGGYQVYWVEGLALAPNQLDFTDTATSGTGLNKTGGLFMHGAHLGLQARW
jgi:hypothetical protein